MKKRRKKIKRRIKKIIYTLLLIIILTISVIWAIKYKKRLDYEKTYEYRLTTIGYELDDAKKLDKIYKDQELDYLLQKESNDIYLKLPNTDYFIYNKFYDYIDYYENNKDMTIRDIVEIVNTNRNYNYYENSYKTEVKKKELMLVNKYYHLDKDYIPDDLVSIETKYSYGEYGSKKIIKEVYNAFISMWNDAHDNNYYLMVSSAYRDYEHQNSVYNDYKKQKGIDYADSIAARPGYSEHQTGYALDIFENGYTQSTFHKSESYKWLQDNAHKYGFIERFPKDKESITGYGYESWHYRYVGVKAATYIHDHKITFDEYYEYYVK